MEEVEEEEGEEEVVEVETRSEGQSVYTEEQRELSGEPPVHVHCQGHGVVVAQGVYSSWCCAMPPGVNI